MEDSAFILYNPALQAMKRILCKWQASLNMCIAKKEAKGHHDAGLSPFILCELGSLFLMCSSIFFPIPSAHGR